MFKGIYKEMLPAMLLEMLMGMLLGMLLGIVVALQVVVLVMLGSATKLQTTRTINGTNFNGTGNITTAKWGTARKITISGAVSGNANVDGSGDVTISVSQANMSILTGSFTAKANTAAKVKDIAYPTGFSKSNCVIIAYGRQWSTNTGYAFGHHSNDSAGMMYASNDGNACLGPSNIELWYRNISQSDVTINYKLVLLKVS